MERDFEYEAGRNQASRQWHMKKRKEAEDERDHLRAEITQLRADLEQERELADRLASSVEWFLSETETYRGDEPMDDHGGLSWNQINEYWIRNEDIAADILTAHATRRNK